MSKLPGLASFSLTTRFKTGFAYPRAIWGVAILFIVMPDFMEVVLVQLADKARKVAVLEMLRQNGLGEAFVLAYILSKFATASHVDQKRHL